MWRMVLEVSLAASVGVNVYLLTRQEPPGATTIVTAPGARACPPVAAASVVVPVPSDASVPKVVCPPPTKADCSAIETKLDDTAAQLESHLPPNERYKHAPRSVDAETRAHALLDPVFAKISKSAHAYDVECHGSVCELSVLDPALSAQTWMQQVQRHGGFQGWTFSPAGVYAELGTPDVSAHLQLMGEIYEALDRDAGLGACAAGKQPTGSLTLEVTLEQATRQLHVTAAGSLANEPIGVCVRTHVQGVLDAMKVPDALDGFSQEFPLLR